MIGPRWLELLVAALRALLLDELVPALATRDTEALTPRPRGLSRDDLLTGAEVAQALGIPKARARLLLARVAPLRIDARRGARRWRWGDVLDAMQREVTAGERMVPEGRVAAVKSVRVARRREVAL